MSGRRKQHRLGVLVPFTNSNLEQDLNLLTLAGVSTHVTRMGGYSADEIPDETQMSEMGNASIDPCLDLLAGVKPDVVLYGCTSATLTNGSAFDRDLARKIRESSGAACVTAAGALGNAIKALGVKNIAFASPYVPAINDDAIAFLESNDISTVSRADVDGILDNEGQGDLTPVEVAALARRADSLDAEAIVLSCTDMRSVEVIAELERDLGKPVLTSNQAMIFQAAQILGKKTGPNGYGVLFNRLSEPETVNA